MPTKDSSNSPKTAAFKPIETYGMSEKSTFMYVGEVADCTGNPNNYPPK